MTVVYILEPPTVTLTNVNNMTDDTMAGVQRFEQSSEDITSSVSTNDTMLLMPAEGSPGHRSKRWPSEFIIPRFA